MAYPNSFFHGNVNGAAGPEAKCQQLVAQATRLQQQLHHLEGDLLEQDKSTGRSLQDLETLSESLLRDMKEKRQAAEHKLETFAQRKASLEEDLSVMRRRLARRTSPSQEAYGQLGGSTDMGFQSLSGGMGSPLHERLNTTAIELRLSREIEENKAHLQTLRKSSQKLLRQLREREAASTSRNAGSRPTARFNWSERYDALVSGHLDYVDHLATAIHDEVTQDVRFALASCSTCFEKSSKGGSRSEIPDHLETAHYCLQHLAYAELRRRKLIKHQLKPFEAASLPVSPERAQRRPPSAVQLGGGVSWGDADASLSWSGGGGGGASYAGGAAAFHMSSGRSMNASTAAAAAAAAAGPTSHGGGSLPTPFSASKASAPHPPPAQSHFVGAPSTWDLAAREAVSGFSSCARAGGGGGW